MAVTNCRNGAATRNGRSIKAECVGCVGLPCEKAIPESDCVWYKVAFAQKVKAASVPKQFIGKTFAEYEKTPDNSEALQIAKWYLAEKPKRSLYFYGAVGTGKTFLVSLIAQEFITAGKRVIFGDVPSLLQRIKATFDGAGNAQDVLDSYYKCDLLILDDIGAGQITDWNIGIIYQIINSRYNDQKPILVTSNFDLDGLQKRLGRGDELTAERITSRLCEMCYFAFFGLNDRRK